MIFLQRGKIIVKKKNRKLISLQISTQKQKYDVIYNGETNEKYSKKEKLMKISPLEIYSRYIISISNQLILFKQE